MFFGNHQALKNRAYEGHFPAPVGGLNARDGLPSMPISDAILLDNFNVDEIGIVVRNGFDQHATGLGAAVETLIPYEHPTDGSKKLFGAAGTSIFDVTSSGAVGAAAVTGLTNVQFQTAQFSTAGSNYTFLCNGADDVYYYDGSSWTQPSITGATSADLINVNVHGNRLFFIEKESMSAWYMGLLAVSGPAVKLDFGPLARRGGHLLAMATITRDSGTGGDDLAAFITSEGEVFLFGGSSPTSAATWSLVGIYNIPKPVGRRCVTKIGADVAVITAAGVLPLSGVLGLSASGQYQAAVTDKVGRLIYEQYLNNKTVDGWLVEQFPTKEFTIVNVPVQDGQLYHQYVANTRNGAWSRWTGLNAMCWKFFDGDMYWGDLNGVVCKINTGFTDNGNEIIGTVQTAFSRFDTSRNKIINLVRPIVFANTSYDPSTVVLVDYNTNILDFPVSETDPSTAQWDVAPWDQVEWSIGPEPVLKWVDGHNIGTAISIAMSVEVSEEFRINGFDILYEVGGFI